MRGWEGAVEEDSQRTLRRSFCGAGADFSCGQMRFEVLRSFLEEKVMCSINLLYYKSIL